MGNKVWYLKRFSLFEGLPHEEVERLGHFLEDREVSKTQIIFTPEDENKVFLIWRDGKHLFVDCEACPKPPRLGIR